MELGNTGGKAQKNPAQMAGLSAFCLKKALTLAGFHTRVLLVNHVNTPMTADHAAVLVAGFRGFQGVTDLHKRLSGQGFIRWRGMPVSPPSVNPEGFYAVTKRSFVL
jgi:hypothetical protein